MVSDKAKSGPMLSIAFVHRRLGNLHAALECLEMVIDMDPTGEFADTGAAWDAKGIILQQLGAKWTDAAFCFGQVRHHRNLLFFFKPLLRARLFTPLPPMAMAFLLT